MQEALEPRIARISQIELVKQKETKAAKVPPESGQTGSYLVPFVIFC